jgi:hypothetical protein
MSTSAFSIAPAPPTPASAVEVVTSLGASVVSVDTLVAAPAARRHGWAFIAAGAALLTIALATFCYGVLAARRDAAAFDQWTAEKRPSWAFRPTRHGAGADVAAMLGAIAGLGLVATGLIRRKDAERTRLRVGQNDGVDIPLADAPPERTLVERDATGTFVAPIDGVDGDVAYGGTATTLAAMRAAGHVALPLYVGTQVRSKIGNTSFFVRGITAPVRSAPPVLGWERRTLAFVAASAVAHMGLWALMRTAPPDMLGAPTAQELEEDTTLRAASISKEDPNPVEPDETGDDDAGNPGSETSPTAIALQDGALGHNEPNLNPARLRVKNRFDSPTMSREEAKEMASRAGILGAIVGPISVADGAVIASGMDDLDITGGLIDGGGQGAPAGSFGWGLRGTGTGCGTLTGVPCSGIASDPFATGGNDGSDNYTGPVGDGGPGRKHVPVVPIVRLKPPTTCSADEPCLDEALIRRYVKRSLSKISYCYEKELLAKPGLEGTVVALFTISASGNVIESRASGVDPEVSSCIADVISHIAFPKLAESGAFPIKYPFQLHPRGG